MMKVAAAISVIALLFTSGLEALYIVSPVDKSIVTRGDQINILVENGVEENFVSAAVTIASACGNIVTNVPIGTTQTMFLPCQITGDTVVSAIVGDVRAPNVHIFVSPVYNTNVPGYIPGAGCEYPYAAGAGCGSPCGPIACPPRPSCRRSRRGCGYYGSEEAVDVTEFVVDEQSEQEQEQQQDQEQEQEQQE